MDIADIGKVANRKRLNVEAEKLREKVSRETEKIIKLKVAQDTAYWDLKEKLQQVEGNHERLQQNMVEVQMQYEAISGQYQDELRLHPETLNKMSSTRKICDVLEEYSERLKETLARCKSDQATLCDAYKKSGHLVRDIKQKQLEGEAQSKQHIERLEEKLKLTSEHQSQMLQFFTATKQQTDAELADTKQKLATVLAQKDELLVAVNDLRRQMDLDKLEIQKKEESISSLQKDMNQLLHEFNLQAADMKNTILKQDKNLKEASESHDALKKALCNQEAFTKSICDQNNQLQEKISSLEEENIAANNTLKDLEGKLQEATTKNEENQKLIDEYTIMKDELEVAVKTKDDALNNAEAEIQNLKELLSATEAQMVETSAELAVSKDACSAKTIRVQELETLVEELQKKIEDLEKELAELRSTTSQQIEELTRSVHQKDKELDSKAGTIAQLMTELKSATDASCKLELNLQRLRQDTDAEREAAREKEKGCRKQIEQLETVARNKDNEISKQLSIILEIRSEKERLQDKINGMQSTIDNIQKELSGRLAPPSAARHPPDHDDNANMCAPSQEPPLSPKLPVKFPAPRADPKPLDLFSVFSDSSADGDRCLNPAEVNRRFEALSRGERLPPLTLGGLKRRAGVPTAHPSYKYKPTDRDTDPVSLSQIKNDIIKKDKSFFKTKRGEAKNKKK